MGRGIRREERQAHKLTSKYYMTNKGTALQPKPRKRKKNLKCMPINYQDDFQSVRYCSHRQCLHIWAKHLLDTQKYIPQLYVDILKVTILLLLFLLVVVVVVSLSSLLLLRRKRRTASLCRIPHPIQKSPTQL